MHHTVVSCREDIYGIPAYLFAECLISVLHKNTKHAEQLVSKHKNGGEVQIDEDFVGIAALAMKKPTSLQEANLLAANLIAPLTEGSVELPKTREAKIFFDRVCFRFLANDPERLSDKRLLEPIGLKGHNGFLNLNCFAEESWRRKFQLARMDLDDISRFDDSLFSSSERETMEVIRFAAETNLLFEKENCFWCDFPANQVDGIPFMLPMIFTTLMSLEDEEDCNLYNQRLKQAGKQISLLAEYVALQHSKGYSMPGFACDKVIEMLETFCGDSITAKSTPFASPFTSLPESLPTTFVDQAYEIITTEVIPAYKKLKIAIANSRPNSEMENSPPGLHRLPTGKDYYVAALRSQSTTSFSPQEIYKLGLEKVQQIQEQMRSILVTKLSQPEDINPIQFMRDVNSQKENRKFFYAADEKEICLADFASLLAESESLCSNKFNLLPKTSCKIIRVPEHMEKGMPAAFYWPPSLDGKRPGAFYANVGNISAIQKYEMRTLTAHEGVPGHHFQLALAAENTESHLLRKIEYVSMNAFWEGWALHAELLAGECGFYDKDPFDWLGHYGDALFRAARLVVDSALHCDSCREEGGFTREEAIKYMNENTTLDPDDILIEVNRYITFPAQATGYMLGKICMEEEREKWRNGGGDDISFHDFVLSTCGLPLDSLRSTLKRAIQIQN